MQQWILGPRRHGGDRRRTSLFLQWRLFAVETVHHPFSRSTAAQAMPRNVSCSSLMSENRTRQASRSGCSSLSANVAELLAAKRTAEARCCPIQTSTATGRAVDAAAAEAAAEPLGAVAPPSHRNPAGTPRLE
eukprot:3032199-Amphidinium_carterae.1